ncbi:MAG: class I SAM-dependent methyltransferase [Saprospiraceae bacterium]|nr:class I SAM-dependent methyltransferase [Saprospiraceae bacterium]
MEKQFEQLYHDLERQHWWFNSRRKQVLEMAKPVKGEKILDVGCASGLLLEDLVDAGMDKNDLHGIDVSEEAIEKCHTKGFANTHVMDGAAITLEKGSFDLLIASDCLEHIENDEKALSNWFSLLKPGGRIVVFVPAFMSLWSAHDVVNYHFRRYTKPELASKAKKAGFKIVRKGYWNFFLFLPILMVRSLKNLFGEKEIDPEKVASDLQPTPAPINQILKAILRIEAALLKMIEFPFGVSTYFTGRKQ